MSTPFWSLGDFTLDWAVRLEAMMDHRRPLRGVQQPRSQTDQAPGWNREHNVGIGVVSCHFDQLTPAGADQLHHRAELVAGHFDDEALERLFDHAAVAVEDDVRLADRQLIAFAAHRFDEHREMQYAAAEDLERIARIGRLDAEGDVAFQFAFQTG